MTVSLLAALEVFLLAVDCFLEAEVLLLSSEDDVAVVAAELRAVVDDAEVAL